MARLTGPDTIQNLLDAGYAILAERGLANFTLNAVVSKTKLTKGALLHHFPSMDDLALRLMMDAIAGFDAAIEQVRGDDRSAGSYTRAYLQVTLQQSDDPQQKQIFHALLELSRDVKLKDVFKKAVRRWSTRIESDELDPTQAQLLRLAADGLWWVETAGAEPLSQEKRSALVAVMLRMAQPARHETTVPA